MHAFGIIVLLPLAALGLETRLSAARAPLLCGEQGYNRTQYHCWSTSNGSSLLCPIVDTIAYRICGDECYFPYHYRCKTDHETLVPLPVRTSQFAILTVSDTGSLNLQELHARNKRFYLGGRNDEYCPLPFGECPDSSITTVFNPDGSLAVYVPGGQQTYIKTDGTLSYTEVGNASKPDMLYRKAGTAYRSGALIGPNGTSWAACDDGTGERYIVAVPEDAVAAPDGCEKLTLRTYEQLDGVMGAYQYGK